MSNAHTLTWSGRDQDAAAHLLRNIATRPDAYCEYRDDINPRRQMTRALAAYAPGETLSLTPYEVVVLSYACFDTLCAFDARDARLTEMAPMAHLLVRLQAGDAAPPLTLFYQQLSTMPFHDQKDITVTTAPDDLASYITCVRRLLDHHALLRATNTSYREVGTIERALERARSTRKTSQHRETWSITDDATETLIELLERTARQAANDHQFAHHASITAQALTHVLRDALAN